MAKSRPDAAASARKAHPEIAAIERPSPAGTNAPGFGSDVVAETLRDLDIPYIALNPGASYRGLHDSLVNYLGNAAPQMLLCLHEEAAIAIAHGYAKVTGRAMAAAVHSNVGLMHGTMAIFNAWCDRMPIIILGATGPVDAVKRRPWIDWIHTARDQGALIRPYTKWDDQPASPGAAREGLLRAWWLANAAPQGPVYLNLDAEMQEAKLTEELPPIDIHRFIPAVAQAPAPETVAKAIELLAEAKKPLILAGRVSRSLDAWNARVALAEAVGARVGTNLKVGAAFPTDHPLHVSPPAAFVNEELVAAIKEADVIMSLDWVDLAGTFKSAGGWPSAKVIQVSLDQNVHNGWSMDHQALPPVDLFIAADTDATVAALLEAWPKGALTSGPKKKPALAVVPAVKKARTSGADEIAVEDLALNLREQVGAREVTLTHVSLSWHGAWWHFHHPLDYVGSDGGGGVGGGPGITVGTALALKGTGRMAIGVCGDGDFLMSCTSLWTAVHYRIPLLIVVANNRSFYNDEVHQERMAVARKRPVENKWIGQRMGDPEIDLAQMARAQGAQGYGPITKIEDLAPTFAKAIAAVEAGGVAVVDVRVKPGYGPNVAAAMTRKT
jgi:thiamine pyrophosphate-dependent acetolactate synthase large subunit-like protein